MPAASHQPLDPENPDILYGSTSSLWDARHPIEWAIKRIAALGLQGIEPYAKQIENHRADPLALKEKFDEQFLVMKGSDLRDQFGVNQWLQQKRVITSLDLAKRDEILPGLRQVHWDLVIVDEAHRMSARDESHKSLRYKLGELLRDTSDHLLMLTATPHRGDPVNFSLFLQLLDADAVIVGIGGHLLIGHSKLDQGSPGSDLIIAAQLHRTDATFTVTNHAVLIDDPTDFAVIAYLIV